MLVSSLVAAVWVVWLDYSVRTQFEGKRWSLPARVFARPLELYVGMPLTVDVLKRELTALGYQASGRLEHAGTYSASAGQVRLHTRSFRFWDAAEPARRVRVQFSGGRVAHLVDDAAGGPLGLLRLDPPLIGAIQPALHEDRTLVRLADVPPMLVAALIETEDRNFQSHFGIDPRGIARAMWANLRAGGVVQGGSTLTQQLAKNFYLTPERSLWRKLREAVMAVLLEARYDKGEILQAYLNEIYLGQEGRRAIHGVGLASHFYFGRPVQDLGVADAALLVAMVKGPSYYNPRRQPERATRRRNLVIDRLAETGHITAEEARVARGMPLGVTVRPTGATTAYPAFMDLVRRQLRRDYREEDLRTEGLRIFTTLDPHAQLATEQAVAGRLERLEKDRGLKSGTLEAAAVLTTTGSGEVLALVGGRRARYAGFNRALDALRPVGSLIKPAVYLAALSRPGSYTLMTPLDDGRIELKQPDGSVWEPQNFDRKYHGQVTLRHALINSLNLATVRLGLDIGLPAVLHSVQQLGVRRPLKPYPSTLLGAAELSPLEVAQMYQTLAANGFRSPVRAIREVLSADGTPLQRYPLTVAAVDNPPAVYLVNTALHDVTRIGTGKALAHLMPEDFVAAGKTGTTDGLRDGWFAGFTDDRLAVVWVGRDDNGPTGLTGSGGALRVWADIMRRIPVQPLLLAPPAGVETVVIDLVSGLRGDSGCPERAPVAFIAGSAPASSAPCARGAIGQGVEKVRGWFDDLLSD